MENTKFYSREFISIVICGEYRMSCLLQIKNVPFECNRQSVNFPGRPFNALSVDMVGKGSI